MGVRDAARGSSAWSACGMNRRRRAINALALPRTPPRTLRVSVRMCAVFPRVQLFSQLRLGGFPYHHPRPAGW